jgi:hypothetical protein
MRTMTRAVAYLLVILGAVLFFDIGYAPFIVSAVLIILGEVYLLVEEYQARVIELANRRDCMIIAEAWPGDDGDGPALPDIYDGLYEYWPADQVETRLQAYREALVKAGNESVGDHLPEGLQLPLVSIYNRDGANRMESREQYAARLAELIKEVNVPYHFELQAQNKGANYMIDYILKR